MPNIRKGMMGAAGVSKGAITTPPGKLFTWGKNTYNVAKPGGQLGLGDVIDRSSPVQVGSLETYQVICPVHAGNFTGHFITSGGTLWGTGSQGATGYIGNSTQYTDYSSPVQVGSLTTWANVVSGTHSLAVKTDGTLWVWGLNTKGQLGLGRINTADGWEGSSSPVQVGSLTNWAQGDGKITIGQYTSAAVKTDGTLWTWGMNTTYGALGLGDTTNRSSPVQVGSLTDWDTISGGNNWFFAKKTDGTIWSWGGNGNGYLGDGTTTNRSSPAQVGSLTTWSSIQASQGGGMNAALKTDGTLWVWGLNSSGQLGIGSTTHYSSPVQVGSLTDWGRVSGGENNSGALKTDGTLWTWGNGGNGQLGHGNTTNYSSPVQVGDSTDWSRIVGGSKFFWAIKEGSG